MSFSFTNYAAMKPGEDTFNPLAAILQGMKERNEMQQKQAALQSALLENQKQEAQQPYWGNLAKAQMMTEQGKAPYEQAQTEKTKADTKFMPLEMSIKAQNSTRASSRFNAAYQLHKYVMDLPPAERYKWIAENAKDWVDNLSTLLQSSKEQPPDYVSRVAAQFFPQQSQDGSGIAGASGVGGVGGAQNNSQLAPADQQQLQQQIQLAQQLQQQQSGGGGGGGGNPQSLNPALAQQLQQQFGDRPIAGKALQEPQPLQQQLQQQTLAQQPQTNVSPQLSNIDDFKLGMQDAANRHGVTPEATKRAESAITLEKFLSDNRKQYSEAMRSASKYSGFTGNWQKLLDAVQKTNPEDYKNFIWLKTAFVPNAINQIKRMEGLSSSNKQRDELQKTLGALQRIDLDPAEALKLFNKQIGTVLDVSDSVIDTAEPNYKGIYRRKANINRIKGDYILPAQNKPDRVFTANGQTYHVFGKRVFRVKNGA